ncbi:hypothetical protein GQX73_g1662 [Xylaria multiplex]|uniref:Yeast cell wall synthesis Kre9/Knh1-like N-terminal domain-containing protein n=1 Tax=Xylaria multiplex TaxID=323545 RepID=A0A7C8IXZ9_9PEZI|nr:hypothetical protein GQX73_g1662 [Xylaria multiplex]
MVHLQGLVILFILTKIVFGDNSGFFDIVAPRENEVLDSNDLTYTIKWTAKSSDGTCKINLLAGSTPDQMTYLSGIASNVDIVNGSFAWPVQFSPLNPELHLVYGIKIILDGDPGVSDVSAPFRVTNGDDILTTTSFVTTGSASQSLPKPTQDATGSTGRLPSGTESRPEATDTRSPPPMPANDSNRQPVLSKGVIAGVVAAAVLSLIIFSGLIGLVLYYRGKLLARIKRSISGRSTRLEMGGRFRRAELDARGTEVHVTKLYELDGTREVREADGKMKPAELDAHNTASRPLTFDSEDKSIYARFGGS